MIFPSLMDPRITAAAVKNDRFDPKEAAEKILRGDPLAGALEISEKSLLELRAVAFELAASGHLSRARSIVETLVLLGDSGPATAMILACCMHREGRIEDANALTDKCLNALDEKQRAMILEQMKELGLK